MKVGSYVRKKYTENCGWVVGLDWSTIYFIVRFDNGSKEECAWSDLEVVCKH